MVDTKQKLHNLITKHKDNTNYDTIVNDLCRLYFEVEEQERKESPFEGSQVKSKAILKNSPVGDCLKELENDLITEQSLLDLGFERKTPIIFQKKYFKLVITHNIQNKELLIYDNKSNNTIILDRLFKRRFELKNLLNSLT